MGIVALALFSFVFASLYSLLRPLVVLEAPVHEPDPE